MSGELIRGFESQLRQRLQQKTTQHVSEETCLAKTFKYFDLNNNGTVCLKEFQRVLEKLGVWLSSDNEVQSVFNYYDQDKSGSLDYTEFIGNLYNLKSSRPQTGVKKGFGQKDISDNNNEAQALLVNLRNQLKSRGGSGILGLGRQFKIMDDNNNKKLELTEFVKGMHDFKVKLSEQQCSVLFNFMDRTGDGTIDFDEFLVMVRGPMNAFRGKFVDQAFNKLDKTGDGQIQIDDLVDVYSVEKHPDYINGKKTKQQILMEFMHTFEQYSDIRSINDGIITREEFHDYYNFISASIDNDQYFELMMNNCWRINEGANRNWDKKGWSNTQDNNNNNNKTLQQAAPKKQQQQQQQQQNNVSKQSNVNTNKKVEELLVGLRKKISSRGANGIFSLGRLFRNIDDNNSKSLSQQEFHKCLTEFRLNMSDSEIESVFQYFDRDGNNELSYDEFLRGVRGDMSQNRVKFVRMAFNKLDSDKSGIVDIYDIKQFYNAKMHPDVKAGKKTEDQVLGEFLDTFEQHHSQKDGSGRDGQVNFDEFVEYYSHISCSIDNDEYFELMIKNAWQLDGHNKSYGKGWASQV